MACFVGDPWKCALGHVDLLDPAREMVANGVGAEDFTILENRRRLSRGRSFPCWDHGQRARAVEAGDETCGVPREVNRGLAVEVRLQSLLGGVFRPIRADIRRRSTPDPEQRLGDIRRSTSDSHCTRLCVDKINCLPVWQLRPATRRDILERQAVYFVVAFRRTRLRLGAGHSRSNPTARTSRPPGRVMASSARKPGLAPQCRQGRRGGRAREISCRRRDDRSCSIRPPGPLEQRRDIRRC